MRNIVDHPITRQEKIEAISKAMDDQVTALRDKDAPIGDITVAALAEVRNGLMAGMKLGDLSEELARAMEPECWRMVDLGHECDGVKAKVVRSISHAAACIMVLKDKGII